MAVDEAVRHALHAASGRLEGDRDDGRAHEGQHRVRAGRDAHQAPDTGDHGDVTGGGDPGHGPHDHGLVDHQVDVVQPILDGGRAGKGRALSAYPTGHSAEASANSAPAATIAATTTRHRGEGSRPFGKHIRVTPNSTSTKAATIAAGQNTPTTDVQVIVETITVPTFGFSIAVLAVIGAMTRTLGNPVTALPGVLGGVGFGLAGATILFTDRLDFLFPAASGIALWTLAAGIGLLLRQRAGGPPARGGQLSPAPPGRGGRFSPRSPTPR